MNQLYELHRQNNLKLARSLVVKFSYEAIANNDLLRQSGKVVPEDPKGWRYYMNLNGDYHPSNIEMKIVSLDTRKEIVVNKSTLAIHPITRKELRVDGVIYRELMSKYPTQSVLIKGLILPVPPERSIAAKNGEILNYESSLVEPQETNLIPRLNEESIAIFNRWHIDTHPAIGELHSAAFLIAHSKAMFDTISLIRQENVHTNKTHSYHIWRYLASHGKLDRFRPYLTNHQALWLYRELKLLINNAGQNWALEELIENLLTPIGIKAYYLDIEQNNHSLLNPTLTVRRQRINFKEQGINEMIAIDTDDVNDRLALGKNLPLETTLEINQAYRDKATDLVTASSTSKVIETLVTDNISLISDPEITFLIRQWGYLALKGLYKADIEINEKRSGVKLTLDVKTAYLLYLRMQMYVDDALDFNLEYFGIPRSISMYVPALEDILANNHLVKPSHVAELLTNIKITAPLRSVLQFQQFATGQRNAITKFDLHGQQQQNSYKEAAYYSVIHLLRRDVSLPLDNAIKDNNWLFEISPALLNYRREEAKELIKEILIQATGMYLLEGYNKSAISEQLSKLISELSTYHVSFIKNEVDESALNCRIEVPKVCDYTSIKTAKCYRIPRDEDKVVTRKPGASPIVIPDNKEDTIVHSKNHALCDLPQYQISRVRNRSRSTIRTFYSVPSFQLIENMPKIS